MCLAVVCWTVIRVFMLKKFFFSFYSALKHPLTTTQACLMKKLTTFKILSTIVVFTIGLSHVVATAQEVELKGEIKCGPPISGGQAYSQPLSIRIKDGYGTGITESAEILENQEVVLTADGSVRYNAIGIWKNQPHRRWRIYALGTLNGLTLQATGSMYANSASDLVRPKCEIRIESPVQLKAPESNLTNYKIETVGDPLGLSPSTINGGAQFREWGLERGLPWSVQVQTQSVLRELAQRSPSFTEKLLMSEARNVVQQTKAKAMIFLDDGKVVAAIAKPNIKGETLLPSASMAKTVTALAVGKAICDGKLSLSTTAESLISSLRGTDLGKSSLRDILLMSSGSAETATQHTHGITYEETRQYLWNKDSSVKNLVSSPRISTAKAGSPTNDYKSTDPYLAALMVQQATATPFTQWLSETIFKPAGVSDTYVLDVDRQGNFLATAGVRLSMNDWIRLAIFIQEQRDLDTCFGKFVKDLSKSQIKIQKQDGVNGYFNGYSYFTWTDNDQAAQTAWAVGHNGQRIGWSIKPQNKKIFLTFGDGSDAEMGKIYPLANRWIN